MNSFFLDEYIIKNPNEDNYILINLENLFNNYVSSAITSSSSGHKWDRKIADFAPK